MLIQIFQGKQIATPLFFASQNGYIDIVTLLLKANANANLQTVDGATPLYSCQPSMDAVTLLLKAC